MFSFLDKDKIYDEERSALKDARTDIDFDAGDYLRDKLSYLFGKGGQFSKEKLLEGAREKEVKKIEQAYQPDRKSTLDAAGNLGGVTQTSTQIVTELNCPPFQNK